MAQRSTDNQLTGVLWWCMKKRRYMSQRVLKTRMWCRRWQYKVKKEKTEVGHRDFIDVVKVNGKEVQSIFDTNATKPATWPGLQQQEQVTGKFSSCKFVNGYFAKYPLAVFTVLNRRRTYKRLIGGDGCTWPGERYNSHSQTVYPPDKNWRKTVEERRNNGTHERREVDEDDRSPNWNIHGVS